MEYEAIIGLEIHIELNSATKMFCDCPNRQGDLPNQNICPICLWLPGVFARISQEVLEKATLTCLALNCEIQHKSAFDQKVYYYPDLPKGFQLSQFHLPLARNGWVNITDEHGSPRKLRISEIHMEEDVAKLVHETEGRKKISLVDFNRAGTPLVEVVTQPDMRSSHDAMEFVNVLRTLIPYVGTAECSMEHGTMRVDANISLRPAGTQKMNVKVEVKNMNSVRSIGDAIAYEINRQKQCYEEGKEIILHTRLWDPAREITVPMRGKFSGPCIPDPSVSEIEISDEWLGEMKNRLPEMPAEKQSRFIKQYKLTGEQARTVTSQPETAQYFESVVKEGISPRTAVHWLTTQLLPAVKKRSENLPETTVTPERIAKLLSMVEKESVNANAAKEVLALLFESEKDPADIVAQQGFEQISDTGELETVIDKILSDNPQAVKDFHSGKTQAVGFLTGQVIRLTQGKANPKTVRKLLEEKMK